MSEPYLYLEDLRQHAPLPPNGILSRTLAIDERVKIIQFCFAPGQELSAHTAPVPALLYFAKGEADLQLGTDAKSASEGTLVYMPPRLEHAVRAKTEVVMLLVMFRGAAML
ncbi:MAG: cupin domain-containing protein [Bryobacteraceae bacterium]|nr:cupin domain-containing protein [Bryobacteraceae bacterium]MCX7603102.1 cupin domain-containing protein [Bryobacteraceae bacterium]